MIPPAPPVDTSRCPYCGRPTIIAEASVVYGGRGGFGHVLVCTAYPACDSYVGLHRGTTTPKGTLADKDLRCWRKLAHQVFDLLWQSGRMSRGGAYLHLAKLLEISPEVCHIAWFDRDTCERVIDVLTFKDQRA